MAILDDPSRLAEIDRWLDRLLDVSQSEQARILEECTDTDLRNRLHRLLAVERNAGPLDSAPAALARDVLTRDPATKDVPAGARIGAYRIASLLGEGGSATVWLAMRDDGAIAHEVAVKCLKGGLATPSQRARFLREQQILARLNHPHIASLFDVGINSDGVPYIVMERIDGVSITRYCDTQALAVEARLKLFRVVLSAVAYAHQNLVVHRDLKPGNILVDSNGEPKLLDFGIAKLLDEGDDATQTQGRVLTPAYAAPEQFTGGAITTATDVYALGVVLYELLAGERPTRPEDAHAELQTPSRCVLQRRKCIDGESSQSRQNDARRRAAKLQGDLDALILTATASDPARRYPTTTAFDADIQRFLLRRPLGARRASRSYRTRKYVARHWLSLTAAVAVILALVIGSGIAVWQARSAQAAAGRANAVQNFLFSVFETARPGLRADSLLTTRDLVERAARQLRTQASGADTDAQLRIALGRVYRKLGLLDDALPLLREAVTMARATGDRALLADALEALGHVQSDALRFSDAQRTFSEVLALRRAEDAPPALEAAALLGLGESQTYAGATDSALVTLRNALACLDAAADAEPALRLRALTTLAVALRRAEQPGQAIEIAQKAVANARAGFGERSREAAGALSVLGSLQRHVGNLSDAVASLRETVAIDQEVHHQAVPAHLHNLGSALLDFGDYSEAESLFRDALAAQMADLGADHPAVGNYQKMLALALHALNREAEAEPLLRTAVIRTEHGYGAQSLEVADKRLALADVLLARADVSDARGLYQAVLDSSATPGAGRIRLRALALTGLARADAASNQMTHVEQLAREALATAHLAEALEPLERVSLEIDVAELLSAAGRNDEALELLQSGESRCRTMLPADHPLRSRLTFDQARLAVANADISHARVLLDSALNGMRKRLPAQHPLLLSATALGEELSRRKD